MITDVLELEKELSKERDRHTKAVVRELKKHQLEVLRINTLMKAHQDACSHKVTQPTWQIKDGRGMTKLCLDCNALLD